MRASLAVMASLVATSTVWASVITIRPTTDQDAYDTATPYDFTPPPSLVLGGENDGTLSVGLGSFGYQYRTVVEFRLDTIPSNQQITAADLILHVSTAQPTNGFSIYGYAGDGVISTSDFQTGSRTLLATFSNVGSNTIVDASVTAFIAGLYSQSADYVGFLAASTTTSFGLSFYGHAGSNVATDPQLTIDYSPATATPEPSTMILWSLLGLSVGLWNRRKIARAG